MDGGSARSHTARWGLAALALALLALTIHAWRDDATGGARPSDARDASLPMPVSGVESTPSSSVEPARMAAAEDVPHGSDSRHEVELAVLDGDGVPLGKLPLEITVGGDVRATSTDAAGRACLLVAAGPCLVRALEAGVRPQSVTALLTPGSTTTLRMDRPRLWLHASLAIVDGDAPAVPAAGARVAIAYGTPPSTLARELVADSGGHASFALYPWEMEHARAALRVWGLDPRIGARGEAAPPALPEAGHVHVAVALRRGRIAEIRVEDAAGQPSPGAWVSADAKDDALAYVERFTGAATDAEGLARLPLHAGASYAVTARPASGADPAHAELPPDLDRLTLRLPHSDLRLLARGFVRDERGAPLEGQRVEARFPAPAAVALFARTDPEGDYALWGVSRPGELVVRVVEEPGGAAFAPRERRVAPGAEDVSFQVVERRERILQWLLVHDAQSGEPVPFAYVSSRRRGFPDAGARTTGERGEFALELLEDEPAEVHVAAPGFRDREFVVRTGEPGAVHRVALEPGIDRRFRLVDEDGGAPLVGWSVRLGSGAPATSDAEGLVRVLGEVAESLHVERPDGSTLALEFPLEIDRVVELALPAATPR